MRPRLAATHRAIRASLNFEGIVRTYYQAGRAALEAILVALTLEHAYDPRRLSRAQTAELLGVLFDAVASAAS